MERKKFEIQNSDIRKPGDEHMEINWVWAMYTRNARNPSAEFFLLVDEAINFPAIDADPPLNADFGAIQPSHSAGPQLYLHIVPSPEAICMHFRQPMSVSDYISCSIF